LPAAAALQLLAVVVMFCSVGAVAVVWGYRQQTRPPHTQLIREDLANGVFVSGVHEVAVTSLEECLHYLEQGERNRCDVITFYSPEAVIMTSEDFAPQRGAMHKSIVSNVVFYPQSQPAVAAALPFV
jgi:hypothetical protein